MISSTWQLWLIRHPQAISFAFFNVCIKCLFLRIAGSWYFLKSRIAFDLPNSATVYSFPKSRCWSILWGRPAYTFLGSLYHLLRSFMSLRHTRHGSQNSPSRWLIGVGEPPLLPCPLFGPLPLLFLPLTDSSKGRGGPSGAWISENSASYMASNSS